ncbi:UDP-N-acetylglucosamine 2-epimerase (hydrolyzing) [Citrobacter sp. NCU1]|uniref:UDP-N-acetylglucosamine 2-epimerase n=1 Tax=Citrobacter sp. NCU1 TaxID=2026683 RepID=UPI001391A282|nr:UDP-N-acetylglucosamine 2-epimerase [Citrobacter sp. NCU1]NDO83375.1 UDP-N-acetylglucosamine 2-epimerase (hydrolyzing) [Citrobacter sp. NCU1]
MRRIAVFTGTRAEYGLLYWLMKEISAAPDLELKTVVSGSHLSPEFGLTYRQIEQDGFLIDERIEMLLSSDTAVGVIKSMGLALIGMADALARLTPDVLVILGDRYEALAMAQAAMIMRIPVAHLHGGEITEGAYDDAIRHAITKLSYLHFTANETYRQRVIQLGEAPGNVFNLGAIGLDSIDRTPLMSREALSASLGFALDNPYFVVTYHPVTLFSEPAVESFQALLNALDDYPDYQVIVTYPNADDGGRQLIPLLKHYAASQPGRVLAIPSLGHARYLSAVKHCAAVIGNSSSGIIEVPSLRVPTVNIGQRQKGRMAAASVAHCQPDYVSISSAIKDALCPLPDSAFANPYGMGDVSTRIVAVLRRYPLTTAKVFHDIARSLPQ